MDYATDKTATGLLDVYQQRLAHWAERPIRLLEIGIERGGSLLFWADFFKHPESLILGLDLQLPAMVLPDRVLGLICDQNDVSQLAQVARQYGPFDVIIDDASHFTNETRLCFGTLFGPALKVGGCYVIEDWAVGYWRDRDPRYRGMVEWLAELLKQAPQHAIAALTISLKPGQAYAWFEKGATGWVA